MCHLTNVRENCIEWHVHSYFYFCMSQIMRLFRRIIIILLIMFLLFLILCHPGICRILFLKGTASMCLSLLLFKSCDFLCLSSLNSNHVANINPTIPECENPHRESTPSSVVLGHIYLALRGQLLTRFYLCVPYG